MRETIIQEVLNHKIIAIVRGMDQEQTVNIAKALYAGGIRFIEVTFNQKKPEEFYKTADSIRAIREAMGDKMYVGAGTVTSVELVDMAAEAGALYMISPDMDEAVIKRTRELGLVSMPGAYTATEAKKAYNAGADFVKLFPCIGDAPAYVKALCAPLSHIPFLAVGGVDSNNAGAFIKAGAVGVGVGSSLVNKKWIDAGEYEKITEEAKKMIENINQ
jgi:2-dehydro-3-deoxyphosphogluconate aldolase/(4S)-4-hydroxy-2-oxoglutarate aldolase